jgi:hypothetical protein
MKIVRNSKKYSRYSAELVENERAMHSINTRQRNSTIVSSIRFDRLC